MKTRFNNRHRAIRILLICSCTFFTVPSAAKTRIACIGNSITYGYGVNRNEAYPYRLQQLLDTADYTVQNDGVNAITLLKNGDNPYYRNGKLPDVFTLQPDIITIKLGTNDTKPQNWDAHNQEFKADYLWLIDTLSDMASQPQIWLVLPVPVFKHPTADSWGIRDSILQKIIPIIQEIAAERQLPLIDANTPLQAFPQFFSVDGVHPNAEGLDTIAHIIYRALKAATATTPPVAARYNTAAHNDRFASGINFPVFNLQSEKTRYLDLAGRKMNHRELPSAHWKTFYRWHISSK
ncbi:MAG: hypothetical protein JW863_01060 [Chitinispirillaceae bacterium]|nr:hypothetical protein [Chitinispirillaceae bacterium]